MHADIAAAEELAAPLDRLLTSSAIGVAERLLPNTSWRRFALDPARKPLALRRGNALHLTYEIDGE